MADLLGEVAPSGARSAADPVGGQLSEAGLRRTRTMLLVVVGLWIFEGALRKWLPGGLGTIFYFLRDAILIGVYVSIRWRSTGIRPSRAASFFEGLALALTALGLVEALVNAVPPDTLLLGLRQFLSPLLFISLVLRYCDVRWVGSALRVVVFLAPLQAALCLLQVSSPAQSFINQTGPAEYGGMTSFGDVVRASGTFTASFGLVCYVFLALPGFLVLLQSGSQFEVTPAIRRWTWLSGACLLLLPFTSGSRSILFFSGLVLVVYMVQGFQSRRFLSRAAVLLGAVAVVLVVVFAAYSQAVTAMQDRVESANQVESPQGRIFHQTFDYLLLLPEYTVLGTGLGTHMSATNASPMDVVLEDSRNGLPGVEGWIENETIRWSAEAGVLGVLLSLARQIFGIYLLVVAWRVRRATGCDGWVLWAASIAFQMISGQLSGQPTAQGFSAVGLGLLLLMAQVTRHKAEMSHLGPQSVPTIR